MASKRSDKSLGTLALRVLALQEASGASTFSIDGTAASLQTERRRLYDLVAVLEALEFVTRVRKGDYSWHGRARLAVAIARMSSSEDAPEDGQQRGGLRYIAVQLVRLFLAKSQLSLDETVSSILGEPVRPANAAAAALARRVYDIFNVLISVGVLEKLNTSDRKPAFRWLGLGGASAAPAATAAAKRPAPENGATQDKSRPRAQPLESSTNACVPAISYINAATRSLLATAVAHSL